MPEKLPKTSLTHPLPLAEVTTPDGTGRILFTMCPGKIQPHADTGPWDRDLDLDMDAIAARGATQMLTLMEAHELEASALSAAKLNDACETRGIRWHHCPIVDFNVPNKDWQESWSTVGPLLRKDLKDGEVIVVHCRGGRGRAGLVAAQLLIEFGISPAAAIQQVRAQRPEAIETKIQEDYLHGIGPKETP